MRVDEDQADDDALGLIMWAVELLEDNRESDMAQRAWEHVQGWLTAYEDKFSSSCQPPRYGYQDDECWYVIPQFFEKEMKEAGFNSRRVLIEFAERGWIKTATENGEIRYRVRKRFGGDNGRFIGILKNFPGTGNTPGTLPGTPSALE